MKFSHTMICTLAHRRWHQFIVYPSAGPRKTARLFENTKITGGDDLFAELKKTTKEGNMDASGSIACNGFNSIADEGAAGIVGRATVYYFACRRLRDGRLRYLRKRSDRPVIESMKLGSVNSTLPCGTAPRFQTAGKRDLFFKG